MVDKQSIFLRLLLNRYHAGASEDVLRGLPNHESEKVLSQAIQSNDLSPLLLDPQETLKQIHYSWLIPKLQDLPEKKRSLILALLPEIHAKKLRQFFKDESEPPSLSKPVKSFLTRQLSHTFIFNEILPIDYLPSTAMTDLAKMKKKELVEVIDYLGLFDLADEVHQIVDKKLLEIIYQCLTKKKHLFLRECLHQQDKLNPQRLQLEHWDGDSQKLGKLLHHRGMVRLGYALSGQHPDLLWHITHVLDTGRGEKLTRYCHEKEIPGVTPAIRKQVSKVIQFFKKMEKK